MTIPNMVIDFNYDLCLLSKDLEAKLSSLSSYYNNHIVDSKSLLNCMEFDSIDQMSLFFTNNVNQKLNSFTKQLDEVVKVYYKGSISSVGTFKALNIDNLGCSNKTIEGDNKIFLISKENNPKGCGQHMRYLYKRIKNSFNSYIIFLINKILKRSGTKVLPHNLKIVNQVNCEPFKSIFDYTILQLLSNRLSYVAICNLHSTELESLEPLLKKPVKYLYLEYVSSSNYIKDMKLMESQVGTKNVKLLISDLKKQLSCFRCN